MYIDEFTQISPIAKIGDPSEEEVPKLRMKTGKWHCYMYKQIECSTDDMLYDEELAELKDDNYTGYRCFLLEHDAYRIADYLDSDITITSLRNLHQDDNINICTDTSQLCICDAKYYKGFDDISFKPYIYIPRK